MAIAVACVLLCGGLASAEEPVITPPEAPPPEAEAPAPTPPPVPKGPVVRLETSLGIIAIALDQEHAPKTVANFLRYVKKKHYNGSVFYRVVPGFVIQSGSYDAAGKFKGKLLPPVALESSLPHVRGAIAMARDVAPASAEAEFFIDLADAPGLNADPKAPPNTTGFAVFGLVVEGMDVVDKIAAVRTAGGKGPFPAAAPATPVVISKITFQGSAAAP